MLLKKLFVFIFICTVAQVNAQKKDIPDSLRQMVLATRFHAGSMFAHSIYVENVKGIRPYGFELEYSHIRTDSAIKSKYNCFPRTGFSFTYTNYNSPRNFLGEAYGLSYFLEPNFRVGRNLRLFIRAGAGVGYFTNPYDSIKNPFNHSYSTNINSFLQLDFGLSYPVSKHFAVYAMADFFHSSNAGTKVPNAGVNYLNASIGLQYYAHSTKLPDYKHAKDTSWRHQPVHFDVALFGSPKSGYSEKDSSQTRKVLLGASITAIKQVSNLDALTLGAEVYYDDGLRSTKQIWLRDYSSNVFAGLLIGHQFLLNRFIFSQELGFYVFKQTKQYNETYRMLYYIMYHRWGLTYNIKGNWSVGINMLAHRQVADFIDGRIIYRLR